MMLPYDKILILRACKTFWLKLYNPVRQFLCLKEMPLGISLLIFIATAWGTYYLSPNLNDQFEKQKIKSSYIVENLNSFNSLSRDLISQVSLFNNAMLDRRMIDPEVKQAIQTQITQLQWRALELDIIFDDAESVNVIVKYKANLDLLRREIGSVRTVDDVSRVNAAVEDFADSSFKVIDILAKRGGLKLDVPAPSGRI